MEREGTHLPVLVDEVTFLLRPRHGGWVVDGTIGMGGHAERLLEAGGADTRLLGIDHDPEALARSGARLARFGDRVTLRHGSFRDLREHAREAGVERAAAILLDLGLSSYQLEGSGRGFTFQKDEPLDMRFDPRRGRTAAELIAHASEEELASILFEHREERPPPRHAPRNLEPRERAPKLLEDGGRLGVISFHSGEDRAVKHAFRALRDRGFAPLDPSPIAASDDETRDNPRARSAKLRVLQRMEA